MSLPTSDQGPYQIVVGASGRISYWPTSRSIPSNWSPADFYGTRDECLDWIERMDAGQPPRRQLDLSLMFFGDQENDPSGDRYRLLFEAAKYADQTGFSAIWLPERHFTRFGCLYPSPAVLHAALARETKRIGLRAGSVVLPLHHPARVAEQWAVVDNLSGGRVELAMASGWHPNDFVLAPDGYDRRDEKMDQGIEQVRRLWRGESLPWSNGAGEVVELRTYPTPVQPELKVWLTVAGSRETFIKAGQLGVDVLTHLFSQDIDQLADNIRLYRRSRAEHGWDAETGRVSVALHTFVAETIEQVHQHAKKPYCDYLKSNLGLLKKLAFSRGQQMDIENLSDAELDEMLEWAFDKFAGGRSLLGTPETCSRLIDDLARIGVTEAACLLDFGPAPEQILSHLKNLASLVRPTAN